MGADGKVIYECPACGRSLRGKAGREGTRCVCPACGKSVELTAPAGEASAADSAAPAERWPKGSREPKSSRLWGVLGTVFLIFVGLAVAASSRGGCAGHGQKLTFNGGEVYYTPRVDRDDAGRLGEYLARIGFFDGERKTVQLTRDGRTYQVRVVVKKGIDTDPEFVAIFKSGASELSRNVFGGSRVEIHLCDENLTTLRVVIDPSAR